MFCARSSDALLQGIHQGISESEERSHFAIVFPDDIAFCEFLLSCCANGRIHHTDSLLPLKHPPCREMMEFFSIAELHFLFDPGSIRTHRRYAQFKRFGYFTCRTATPA